MRRMLREGAMEEDEKEEVEVEIEKVERRL